MPDTWFDTEERPDCITLPSGLLLRTREGALELTDGSMCVKADFSKLARRIAPQNLQHELVVRAAKPKRTEVSRLVFDATAGLGEDSFLLAAAGFEVVLFEKNAVVARLLSDGLARAADDPLLCPVVSRMTLFEGDSTEALESIGRQPDIVYLDPMFPAKGKNSLVKKKLQLLQRLELPCDDEARLLEAALRAHPRKVIVKRPAKGPYLSGRKPDYSIAGKAIRFDCYAFAANR